MTNPVNTLDSEAKLTRSMQLSGELTGNQGGTLNFATTETPGLEAILAPILLQVQTSASRLATPREIRLSGDISGNVVFDGSEDVNIATTLTAEAVYSGPFDGGNF